MGKSQHVWSKTYTSTIIEKSSVIDFQWGLSWWPAWRPCKVLVDRGSKTTSDKFFATQHALYMYITYRPVNRYIPPVRDPLAGVPPQSVQSPVRTISSASWKASLQSWCYGVPRSGHCQTAPSTQVSVVPINIVLIKRCSVLHGFHMQFIFITFQQWTWSLQICWAFYVIAHTDKIHYLSIHFNSIYLCVNALNIWN